VLINITGGPDLTLYEVNEASTLIQEAAHEDANIIFGAVIDEKMPEGEMRVTVIATGLDDARMRRGRGHDLETTDRSNVTQLRREGSLFDRLPAAERPIPRQEQRTDRTERAPAPPPRAERLDRADRRALEPIESEPLGARADIISPFEEDELDVPTFLRRGGQSEEDEQEEPAFLRRSAD
jgi:cell division protein FtsZ